MIAAKLVGREIELSVMFDKSNVKFLCGASFLVGCSSTLLVFSVTLALCIHHIRNDANVSARSRQSPPVQAPAAKILACGILEPLEIPLVNPDGAIPDEPERLRQSRWTFENFTAQRLVKFFAGCDLQRAQRNTLLDRSGWSFVSNAIVVSPSQELIWSLSPAARAQIYSVLGTSSANYSQNLPFRFPLKGFDLKFVNSGIPDADLARIRHLTYTNHGYLCFSDLQLMQGLLSPDDFKDLVATLYAVPTYLLRLRVTPDSNVDALTKYWGRGGREKLVAPLISSLARLPNGGSVNLSYFLPPFARLRLYTFPDALSDPTASRQDCFFTAMNFFNETPDTNFFSGEYSRQILDSKYSAVKDEPMFGDVVALFNDSGEAIHTCVYLADDFVFTKNGINRAQPWVIMRLPDMLMIYVGPSKSSQMLFLRRKDIT
jgi:hypothetical protein